MKDYASMSDFEINSAVSMALLDKSENPYARYVAIGDYCNNPADAWPIIFSNRIGIVPGTTTDKWAAHHGDWDIAAADANPLRAAMVVFLMMKESEND